MTAAILCNLASMTLLLQDGRCNLETESSSVWSTAILIAAGEQAWDCVELLLSYHASPIAVDDLPWNLLDYAMYYAPPHTLQLIQAAIAEPDRARLLHRARRINEARHNPATDGPAFLRQRGSSPLPRVELSVPIAGAGNGHEEGNSEEQQTVQRAVLQFVVGMKEDGSVGGGMLKEHVVELMDMMLPVWDVERERE